MSLDPWSGMTPFLAVAEHKSFTAAAARLGVTPTAISQTIKALEQRLGLLLFQRTTRRVSLTEAGASLYARLRPAADEIDAALAALGGYQDRPTGTLRLTLPRSASALLIEPLLASFSAAHPDLTLDLSLDDTPVDLIAGQYDAGIRLGEGVEKDMVAIRLTPDARWGAYGSPAYLARAGVPAEPEALVGHRGLVYRFSGSGALHRWEFQRHARPYTVDLPTALISNDRPLLVSAACAGLGLVYAADFEVADAVATGRLQPLLQDHAPVSAGLYLYFPARTQTQPKLRAFIDCITAVRP